MPASRKGRERLTEAAPEKAAGLKKPRTRKRKQTRYGVTAAIGPGSSPGQLISDPSAEPTVVDVVGYSPSEIVEKKGVSLAEISELRSRFPCLWVDVHGLRDVDVIEKLGQEFALHPLALEDVVEVRRAHPATRTVDPRLRTCSPPSRPPPHGSAPLDR